MDVSSDDSVVVAVTSEDQLHYHYSQHVDLEVEGDLVVMGNNYYSPF